MMSRLTTGFVLVVCFALLTAFIGTAGPQEQRTRGQVCAACHADGDPATGPEVNFEGLAQTLHSELSCTDCHVGVTATHEADLPPANCDACHEETAKEFAGSVHDRATKIQISCGTCHDGHNIQPMVDDVVARRSAVIDACGRCHAEEHEAFDGSIHHAALLNEETADWAPNCTTCHGKHRVYAVAAPASPASPSRLPDTCGGCHDDPDFAESVGVPEDRLASYKDSIHGLRNRFGQGNVATCKDCHGSHGVLPASNPTSTISKKNIVATCAACHEGANENFAAAKVHVIATPESSFGVFVARWFYIIFIGVLMLGFVLHVAFDLISRGRQQKEGGK